MQVTGIQPILAPMPRTGAAPYRHQWHKPRTMRNLREYRTMNTVSTAIAYHFRSFPIVGHSTKQGEELAANASQFEACDATVGGAVIKSWKRKSVEAKVNIPTLTTNETLVGAELELVNSLLANLVGDFVKTQYIDAFKPVGDHSLAAIIAHRLEMASRKPSGLAVPSAEALAIGATQFTAYLSETKPKIAPRVLSSDLFKSGVTDASIKKFLVQVDSSRVTNLTALAQDALDLVPALELGADEAAATQAMTYLVARLRAYHAKIFGAAVEEDDGI